MATWQSCSLACLHINGVWYLHLAGLQEIKQQKCSTSGVNLNVPAFKHIATFSVHIFFVKNCVLKANLVTVKNRSKNVEIASVSIAIGFKQQRFLQKKPWKCGFNARQATISYSCAKEAWIYDQCLTESQTHRQNIIKLSCSHFLTNLN